MNSLKNLFLALLIFSLSLFALVGCAPGGKEDGDDEDGDDGQQTGETLCLVDNGVAKFTVVKTSGLNAKGQKAVGDFIEELLDLGLDVGDVVDDSDESAVKDCEIVIGASAKNREGCSIDVHTVGDDGYIIKIVGNRVLVVPGNNAVDAAMDALKKYYLDIDRKTESFEGVTVEVERKLVKKQNTDYEKTDIKIGETSLSDFAVSYDKTDSLLTPAVNLVRQSIYEVSGIWMPLKDEPDAQGKKYEFIVRVVANAGEDEFRIINDGDNIVMECVSSDKMLKGATAFVNNSIKNRGGSQIVITSNPVFSYAVNAVWYEDFGAVGDGETDDFAAIMQAHEYANQNRLRVKATDGKTYYIGRSSVGYYAKIMTDTDWGNAKFIIDDALIMPYENVSLPIFYVLPSENRVSYYVSSEDLQGLTLSKGASKIDLSFPTDVMLRTVNSEKKVYIRHGGNANSGQNMQEILLVDKNGNIDPSTPVIWDYDKITEIEVFPVDETPITIKGGTITTKANQLCYSFPSGGGWKTGDQYYYYERGIKITRSNVTLYGVKHYIEGENDNRDADGGYPYNGFFNVMRSNNVLLESCIMSGHKVYFEDRDGIKDSGTPMGSYDINSNCSNAITWKNCTQANSVTDASMWGVMGSNYSKNLSFIGCNLSRFDAHEGMVNTTIKDTTIGQYINAIGSGTLLLDNVTKLVGPEFVSFRMDYGSTWEGDIIMNNCTMVGYSRAPGASHIMAAYTECDKNNKTTKVNLLSGEWVSHDFGYTCYLPQNVTVENFKADSAQIVDIFSWQNLNPNALTDHTNPVQFTRSITLKNMPSSYTVNLCSTSVLFENQKNNGYMTVTII